jgi:hypothetical protein
MCIGACRKHYGITASIITVNERMIAYQRSDSVIRRSRSIMHLSELEAQLHRAQARQDETIRRDAPLKERIAAGEAVLEAERALSLAKGEEVAVACDWAYLWDPNDPSPHVLSSALRAYLIYKVNEWKLSEVSPYSSSENTIAEPVIALVEFTHCDAHRFSNINEEVLTGHPLWGKGLDLYGAHEVIHSQWLAEVQRINMVHKHYNPQQCERLKHYLLIFRDNIFECLADGYKIEVLQDSLEHVTELARSRLFEHEY